MKLKPLALAVAVLAVLSVAAFFLTRPPQVRGADPRVGQPLIDGPIVAKAAELRLTDGGKTVTLKQRPDRTWVVSSYYDFPADFGKLSGFVHDLSAATIQRFVTANPERWSQLGFKDSSVTLLDASGHLLWSLTLGNNADTGGRFVRFDDEERGYLAKLDAWLDDESRNWADTTLTRLKPDDVAKVEITWPDAPSIVAARAKPAETFHAVSSPVGQQVRADVLSTLIRSLTDLHFSDTAPREDPDAVAANQHDRTIRLTTFAGELLTIKLGRRPESKKLKAVAAPTAAKTPPVLPAKPGDAKASDAKPAEPEYETVPAGPVFVVISSSDTKAGINAMMAKRAFKVADYSFTSLPQTPKDLFEPIPPPPAKEASKTAATGESAKSADTPGK
ncbi:MAG: DUF4340 domain-containing protein [Opitutales bacterium]